jgi:hypothetical protein
MLPHPASPRLVSSENRPRWLTHRSSRLKRRLAPRLRGGSLSGGRRAPNPSTRSVREASISSALAMNSSSIPPHRIEHVDVTRPAAPGGPTRTRWRARIARRRPNDTQLRDMLLVALTLAWGSIDAISFGGLGRVYSAFQTGNVIVLGLGTSGASGVPVLRAGVSLASFGIGVLVATRIVGHPSAGVVWPRRLESVLVGSFHHRGNGHGHRLRVGRRGRSDTAAQRRGGPGTAPACHRRGVCGRVRRRSAARQRTRHSPNPRAGPDVGGGGHCQGRLRAICFGYGTVDPPGHRAGDVKAAEPPARQCECSPQIFEKWTLTRAPPLRPTRAVAPRVGLPSGSGRRGNRSPASPGVSAPCRSRRRCARGW